MKARLKRKIKHQKKYIQLEELKNLSENSEKNKDSIKIKKNRNKKMKIMKKISQKKT